MGCALGNEKDGDATATDDFVGDAAHDPPAETGASVGGHDDDSVLNALSKVDDGGGCGAAQDGDGDVSSALGDVRLLVFQVGMGHEVDRARGVFRVEAEGGDDLALDDAQEVDAGTDGGGDFFGVGEGGFGEGGAVKRDDDVAGSGWCGGAIGLVWAAHEYGDGAALDDPVCDGAEDPASEAGASMSGHGDEVDALAFGKAEDFDGGAANGDVGLDAGGRSGERGWLGIGLGGEGGVALSGGLLMMCAYGACDAAHVFFCAGFGVPANLFEEGALVGVGLVEGFRVDAVEEDDFSAVRLAHVADEGEDFFGECRSVQWNQNLFRHVSRPNIKILLYYYPDGINSACDTA